jgi:polyphosphate kinase 2
MARKAKQAMKEAKKSDKAVRRQQYSFEDKELPPEVEAHALKSGGYPYDDGMKRKRYKKELRRLQIELLKAQNWVREHGERVVVVFEGRDAAGKGGTIHRLTQHMNPRSLRTVALPKPTDAERGQWYFQRYVAHLPTRGEIVLFDRSWYNRCGVEPVMGFCKTDETERFLEEAPEFERMLTEEGIRLIKFWLHIGREMQIKRFHARRRDPLKRWKLGPVDHVAVDKWDDYSEAYDRMFKATHSEHGPWTVVFANDKLRARVEAIRHFLHVVPYPGHNTKLLRRLDRKVVLDAPRFLARGERWK